MDIASADLFLDLLCDALASAAKAADVSFLNQDLLGRVAVAFDLQRVSLFQVHEAQGKGVGVTCRLDFAPGLPQMASNTHPALRVGGGDAKLHEWAAKRRRGEIVQGLTRDLDGYVRTFFESHSIVNFLTVPVMVDGLWWGHLCADSADPLRQWSDAEIRQLRAFSDVIASVILRSDTQRVVGEASRQALLDASFDAVVIADEAGAIIEFNRAAERIFGQRRDDVVGRPLADTIVPAHYVGRHVSGFSRYIETGNSQMMQQLVEVEGRRADGTAFPVELTISEIKADGRRLFAAYLRDISDRKRAQLALERVAYADEATGLPNLAGLVRLCGGPTAEVAGAVVVQLLELGVMAAVLGDGWAQPMVLETAALLNVLLPKDALVARTAENEFAIVLWRSGAAATFGAGLENRLRTAVEGAGRRFYVHAGIGVVERQGSITDILQDAQLAARGPRPGSARLFDDKLRVDHQKRMELETALRDAVLHRNEEISLRYQPIVSLATGLIVGFEALARWQPNGRPEVSPSIFIPLAEASGLADGLGEWVVECALRDCAAWGKKRAAAGLGPWRVAINLSGSQMSAPDLATRIFAAMERQGLAPSLVSFELTESAILANPDQAIATLQRLRDFGCTTAIDDFGTGHSSFSYLQRLPVDVLKIDRSFVDDLARDARTRDIVRVMLELAHGLGMTVVAEGVEARQTFDILNYLGCDLAQGYLLSRPLTLEAAEALPDLLVEDYRPAVAQS